MNDMRVLITGSRGFIGKNLVVRLGEIAGMSILRFDRDTPRDELAELVRQADAIIHLAGENRPTDPAEFVTGNVEATRDVCAAAKDLGRNVFLLFASSIQATTLNDYGNSKRQAELLVEQLCRDTENPGLILRLPNVFGKWCKPGYNSVVATFCHNVARDLPLRIDNPLSKVRLVYIDDVVSTILKALNDPPAGLHYGSVLPEYSTTVGELAAQITAFKNCRETLISERVGVGLTRALYATYVSYLPPACFDYGLPRYSDARGDFVEMLKTPDCGQFSYFTAPPGVTRGGHYHHSKTEKFLVIRGSARFKFRNIVSQQTHEIVTSGLEPRVVETVPGWTHDITNIGDTEIVVMLWANEIFDRALPDTTSCKV
jgi:UDP-2-acetamido-2,6-beta-L-arabino-hexul-4-ose reductase